MRISLFLFFVCTFQLIAVNTDAQNAQIEINPDVLSFKELIFEIEKHTNYLVLFRNNDVKIEQVVRVKEKSGKISSLLNEVWTEMELTYEFRNKYIVLSKKEPTGLPIIAQSGKKITGLITDEQLVAILTNAFCPTIIETIL